MKRELYVLIADTSPSAYEPVLKGVTFSVEVAASWDNTSSYYKTFPHPDYLQCVEDFIVELPEDALVAAFKAGMLHIADCCNRAPEERVTNGDVALFCEMEADELEDDEILDIILGAA